MTNLLRKHS